MPSLRTRSSCARPTRHTIQTNALFRFTGSDNITLGVDLAYECLHRLRPGGAGAVRAASPDPRGDGGWTACESPTEYDPLLGLGVGRHRFEVRAIDGSDNVDQSAAGHSWNILEPPGT